MEILKKEKELHKLLSKFEKSESAKTQRIVQLTEQYKTTLVNLRKLSEELTKIKA